MTRVPTRPATAPAPKLPGTVVAAAIVWIVFATPILLVAVVTLLLALSVGGGGGAVVLLATLLVGGFGGAFVAAGINTLRGAAADTLGNGIGSIIFGVLFGGLSPGLHSVAGVGLLVAGILALVGRGDYKVWLAGRGRPRRSPYGLPGRTARRP